MATPQSNIRFSIDQTAGPKRSESTLRRKAKSLKKSEKLSESSKSAQETSAIEGEGLECDTPEQIDTSWTNESVSKEEASHEGESALLSAHNKGEGVDFDTPEQVGALWTNESVSKKEALQELSKDKMFLAFKRQLYASYATIDLRRLLCEENSPAIPEEERAYAMALDASDAACVYSYCHKSVPELPLAKTEDLYNMNWRLSKRVKRR